MVVLLIFSIIIGATYTVLAIGKNSFQTGDIQILVQQEARKAIDKIAREVREASSVNLSEEYPFNIGGQKIKYEVIDGQLLKGIQGQSSTILANNINSVQFSVLGGNVVYITLIAQKNDVSGRILSATLTSQVTLRN